MKKSKIDVLMLATPHIEIYTQYSIPIWQKYCRLHGYHFYHYKEKLMPHLAFTWSRIKMIQQHLATSKADYVLMVDADTLLFKDRLKLSLEAIIKRHMTGDKLMIFQKDGSDRLGIYFTHNIALSRRLKRWTLVNAGFNLMRNHEAVRRIIDLWLALAEGELHDMATSHPMTQRVFEYGIRNKPELNRKIGFMPSGLVSKRNTTFCRHLSAMSKEKIAEGIKREYDKIFANQ